MIAREREREKEKERVREKEREKEREGGWVVDVNLKEEKNVIEKEYIKFF